MAALMICVFLLLTAAVNEAQSQEIWATGDNSVTLKCPSTPTFHNVKGELLQADPQDQDQYIIQADDGTVKGEYSCKYSDPQETHYFYINARVCERCLELSGLVATGIIFGDVLITGGVILIAYACSKKNTNSTVPQRASNPRTRNAPRPPNPDYEALDPSTRSKDLYAGIR